MAKKNDKNTEEKKLAQAEKERLDNFVVMLTSIALAVGVVLAVLYNFMNGPHIGAAYTFLEFLQWTGVVAVAVFAVLGVVKNKKLLRWCGVGAYVAINCYIIPRLGTGVGNSVYISGIGLCYYLLALCLIAGYAYYLLCVNHMWGKKGIRIALYAVTIAIAAAILIFAAYRIMS